MRKLPHLIAIFLLAIPSYGQGFGGKAGMGGKAGFGGGASGGGGLTGITYVTRTYVAETNSTPVASITSPALTLSAGQFVIVFCRDGDTTGGAIAASSTPANTWSALTVRYQTGVGTSQMSYALSVGAGSTTFTCTPATSQPYQSMIVREYTPTGGTFSALDTQTGGLSSGAVTSLTSPTFSTSAGSAYGLIVYCVTTGGSVTWTAGLIGGVTGTNVTASSSVVTTGDSACEDRIVNSSQSSITAAISWTTSLTAADSLGAFK